ncbi:hypothetical protein H5410_053282 [Solanum commersonii]|uniref:Uncharacterized protein n=1 Tax=Solanum commersonii TaxID=4109 RepID=A0A9J5X4H1_SOLCO|nr:hypothetical protein H5410_053282 [Solanum commersonii]
MPFPVVCGYRDCPLLELYLDSARQLVSLEELSLCKLEKTRAFAIRRCHSALHINWVPKN